MFSGYPVTGSFSRTAVNHASGAKTQVASVAAALTVGDEISTAKKIIRRFAYETQQLATMPMDIKKLKDGVAIITGSATGMGYAMGKKAKELGMNVVLSDVRQEPLSKAIRTLRMEKGNGRVEGFICDVTSEESLQALLKSTTTAFPGKSIQFIGANAGVIFTGSTILSGK